MLGEKLIKLRKEKGMTQEALADMLQVSRQSVSKWESDITFPETDKLIAISKIFDVSIDFLLSDKERTSGALAKEEQNSKDKALNRILVINRIILIVSGLLPLLITIMLLPFFPPQIPAHYDASGNITRWGSKYENLIFPLVNTILTGLYFITEILMRKKIKTKELLVLQIVFIAMALAMAAVIIWLLIKGYLIAVDSGQIFEINFFQAGSLAFGLMFLVFGSIMPFTPKNALFGLRTSLSMSSDMMWKISQLAGGISLVSLGIIIACVNTFYSNGIFNIVISSSLSVVFITAAIAAPYIIAKKMAPE